MSSGFNSSLENAEWLKNAKVTFYPLFTKKIRERLKICQFLGLLLDDFADYEQVLGKSLTKAYEGNRNPLSNVLLASVSAKLYNISHFLLLSLLKHLIIILYF